MASIGKIALGLVSGEAALALANLNLDFSIVKMEAPPEFQRLGNYLQYLIYRMRMARGHLKLPPILM